MSWGVCKKGGSVRRCEDGCMEYKVVQGTKCCYNSLSLEALRALRNAWRSTRRVCSSFAIARSSSH